MDDRYARKWRALIGISLLSFVGFMDYAIVNTILPGIQADLQATVSQLQWVMNAFFMMLAMFMVTMGRVGDIYGRRIVLYIGVLAFGVASAMAGISDSPGILIAWRVVQGISGAVTFTCATSLVTNAFPQEEQGRAFGIFMSITAFGMAVGPVLGGFFMSFLSWRWAFYVNVPVIVLGFILCHGAVSETERLKNEKVDWLGLCFLVPGIGCLITAIMQGNGWGWLSPIILALFAVAIVAFGGFILVERRVASPIIDLSLFRIPLFQLGIVAGIGIGGFIGIGSFLPPLFLMNIQGYEPYLAGLMLLPITGLVMILPPLVGRWVDSTGPLPFILAGQFVLILAALGQMLFVDTSPAWYVLVALGLFGLSWGLQQGSVASAVTMALPPKSSGIAIGSLWTFWNVGSTVTLSIGGMILNVIDHSRLQSLMAGANISLTDQQQHVIRSLLSDPSRAEQALSQLPSDIASEITPLFHQSFMDGYSGAMIFSAALCALTFLGTVILSRRVRAAAAD
ncbi:MAG: MFS transporter [Pseudomonadota bacterium]